MVASDIPDNAEGVPSLVRQVMDALTAADFAAASEANDHLLEQPLEPASRLFALHARLRLAGYAEDQLDVDGILTDLEHTRSRAWHIGGQPRYWYTLAWLSVPFAAKHPVDIFYLLHLSLNLSEVVMRQECLAQAVHYGVRYSDHHFMAHFMDNFPFDLSWDGEPYYNAKVDYVIAIYMHETERLPSAIENLARSAGTPLQEHAAKRLIQEYKHQAD